ncbi:hypothetical protein BCR43DRAFT_495923 [Syncephalastrum racemosum]|uniref:F-box domain-containing protein n=1 Tax=Syncephalastrum racemosum TaxID=13706 RepID=A0A1X2H6Q2_SYNRA|nr:hypothetical protein BCR43DRAFT_495923 [Syncephalastrum racemosum]
MELQLHLPSGPQRDWLYRMPLEMVDLIFAQLPFTDRVQCTRVSKAWRAFLLEWWGMFRTIELRFFGHLFQENLPLWLSILAWVSQMKGSHLREFEFFCSCMCSWNSAADLLDRLLCNRIEKLLLVLLNDMHHMHAPSHSVFGSTLSKPVQTA